MSADPQMTQMTQMNADTGKYQNHLRKSASSADDSASVRPCAIEVQVEELVLHGFALGDRYVIGEAIERELVRLLGEQAVPFSLRSENTTDELKPPTFKAAPGAKPPAIGRQIAQAVYEGFSQ
jgi:hypothetical protein